MSLSTNIKLYCKANGVNSVNFLSDVIVLDNGSGAEINEWNLDIAEPTAEQLATYESSATTKENNNTIRHTRKVSYGNIGDQLDEIYKDIDAWKTRIAKVKSDNPKE